MQVILVSNRMAAARTITLTWRHFAAAIGLVLFVVLSMSSLFSYVALHFATELRLPMIQNLLLSVREQEQERARAVTQNTQKFVQDNISSMAVRLGQMQAELMRLDSIGEKLAGFAGIKPQELKKSVDKKGQGGMLVNPTQITESELMSQLDALSRQVEERTEIMQRIERQIMEDRVRRNLVPTAWPVAPSDASMTSGFGRRYDPFTGHGAMHEGIDFGADTGTSILAAAGGVVLTAEFHPSYGNMVEVDHGNELVTRYAHASRINVKPGMLVRRGQKIAEVGSTGRSTGPHLHFEVRQSGVAINPMRFLSRADGAENEKVASAK